MAMARDQSLMRPGIEINRYRRRRRGGRQQLAREDHLGHFDPNCAHVIMDVMTTQHNIFLVANLFLLTRDHFFPFNSINILLAKNSKFMRL